MQHQYSDLPVRFEPINPGLEALDDGFFMVDGQWRLTYWNAAAERILGIPRGNALGRKIWTLLPFLEHSSSVEILHRVLRTGESERYIDLFEGNPRGFVSIHAAKLSGGGLAVHFRDATEEVKHARHYSALLESIRDGFVAVDEEWRVVYMNPVAESLLRLRHERARNASLWTLLPAGEPAIEECLRATMADGVKRHLRGVRPEGRIFRGRIYDLWTYPLAGGGISILFEDVSEHVGREEKLAQLAMEAQEANRIKSRFFAAISHELRTPLNAIVGYTHLLETETYGDLPPEAKRAAERASVCAEHLSRLVDDLLVLTATELSRLALQLSPVEIESLVQTAVEPYRNQAEAKGLDFTISVPESLPLVLTDADRARQVLAALLANAVKYTRRGAIRVSSRKRGEEVEFVVEDTGPGIGPADCERVFAPFEQLADAARSNPLESGPGLGLTMARKLATLLGGSLYLERSSAEGSRFVLRLPFAPPDFTPPDRSPTMRN